MRPRLSTGLPLSWIRLGIKSHALLRVTLTCLNSSAGMPIPVYAWHCHGKTCAWLLVVSTPWRPKVFVFMLRKSSTRRRAGKRASPPQQLLRRFPSRSRFCVSSKTSTSSASGGPSDFHRSQVLARGPLDQAWPLSWLRPPCRSRELHLSGAPPGEYVGWAVGSSGYQDRGVRLLPTDQRPLRRPQRRRGRYSPVTPCALASALNLPSLGTSSSQLPASARRPPSST